MTAKRKKQKTHMKKKEHKLKLKKRHIQEKGELTKFLRDFFEMCSVG